jgi:hypothetical protein
MSQLHEKVETMIFHHPDIDLYQLELLWFSIFSPLLIYYIYE